MRIWMMTNKMRRKNPVKTKRNKPGRRSERLSLCLYINF
jgi:hypothetical protein